MPAHRCCLCSQARQTLLLPSLHQPRSLSAPVLRPVREAPTMVSLASSIARQPSAVGQMKRTDSQLLETAQQHWRPALIRILMPAKCSRCFQKAILRSSAWTTWSPLSMMRKARIPRPCSTTKRADKARKVHKAGRAGKAFKVVHVTRSKRFWMTSAPLYSRMRQMRPIRIHARAHLPCRIQTSGGEPALLTKEAL